MTRRRGFDHYLLAHHAAHDPQVRTWTIPQRYCWFLGILPIAGMSPVRGYLLIVAGRPATAADYAHQACVPLTVARDTIRLAGACGIVEMDEEVGCKYVVNWEKHNPEPKADPTAAERQRRRRARIAQLDNVTRVTVTGGSRNAP